MQTSFGLIEQSQVPTAVAILLPLLEVAVHYVAASWMMVVIKVALH